MPEVCSCRLFAVVIAVAGAAACGGGGAPPSAATAADPTTMSPPAAQEAAAPQPDAPDDARAPRAVREQDLTTGSVPPDPMLVREIISLDRLLAATPRDAADRPAIMRRLAEAYAKLEAAQGDRLDKGAVFARDRAIQYYTLLKEQYPKFSNADEVLYYLGFEYEQANRLDDARRAYHELIKSWPTSKLVPNAYLAFADRFFEGAATDPSLLKSAEQAYLAVIRFPPPDNKVWGYARYKLAFVYWTAGDTARALGEMKAAIEYGTQYASSPSAANLANVARRDITSVYASGADPEKAFQFLRPLSGDGDGEQNKTLRMMSDLGQKYLDIGAPKAAVVVYVDLVRRNPGAPACSYLSQIDAARDAAKGRSDELSALTRTLNANRALLDRARKVCTP